MATNHTPTAGAALGNELRAGTVAKVGSTRQSVHEGVPRDGGDAQHDAAVQGFGRGLPFPQRQRV